MDVSTTIVAKSDQLNADDLIGGPITVQILDVEPGPKDQPVRVVISGDHQPWLPCKTMRRLLVAAWGPDSRDWHGRWVTLYRDDSVRWAGQEVGGVRVSHMSHLDTALSVNLTERRNKKTLYSVAPLSVGAGLREVLSDGGFTLDDFDSWRRSIDKPTSAELSTEQQQQIANWLSADLSRLDMIKPHKMTEQEYEEAERAAIQEES